MTSRLVDWILPGTTRAPIFQKSADSASQPSDSNNKISSATNVALVSPEHEHSPVRRKTSNRTIVYIPELHKIRDEAKFDEFKRSLEAIINAFNTQATTPNELYALLEKPTKPPEYYLKLRLHYILEALHAQGPQANEPINLLKTKTIVEELSTILTSNTCTLTQASLQAVLEPHFKDSGLEKYHALLSYHANELYNELTHCFSTSTSFTKEYAALKAKVTHLAELIIGSAYYLESDPKSRTKAILQTLRQALQMPAYLLMRCEEENPCISLLHAVVIGSFAHSETVPSYLKLGKAIADKATIKRVDSLGDILTATRDAAANAGFVENDPLVNDYAVSQAAERLLPEAVAITISKITDIASIGITFLRAGISPFQTIQAIAEYAQAYFCATSKDYRGIYDNLPGALYEETFSNKQGATTTLRVIVSPSPAQGATVLPEFHALLQALQNRRMNPTTEMAYPYTYFTYTNLQNRFGGHEGLQTNALMKLNALYPFSFDAITLSADPLAGCNTFDESIMQKMRAVLLADQSYTLENLNVKSNYYFQPKDKETLIEAFDLIITKAYTLVNQQNQIPPEKKVGVFCDLVHLGIIRYKETKTASSFMQSSGNASVLASRICAVCVDRGMMINSELLYLTGHKARVTAEIDIGRGILSKKRLPLEKRVKQIGVLAHDKHISGRILQFLNEIEDFASKDNPVSSIDITYPGCSDDMLPADAVPMTKRKLFPDQEDDNPPPARRLKLSSES